MPSDKKVVTRFAPSPTGFMHIGGVRTALFAWLWARKNNGTFILRIEDTDKEREVAGSIEHIIESLTWIGISWDYGPDRPGPFGSCIQSERLPIYKKYAEELIAKGHAYPDPYTDEEVAAFREAALAEKRPFLFRNHRPDTFLPWDGTKPLRLKVPEVKRYTWQDAVRGELSAGEEMVDDIVLIKSDGYPTYNFAHIIDDLEMEVTHIMRGEEFISSMPKFLSIYDALGIPYPVFATLPPILRDDRTKKLGKRDGAKDILEYRTEGFLPGTMRNFLALTGWNPGTEAELFDDVTLTSLFTLEGIQRSGAVFNEEKLLWMNKEYLQKLSPDEQLAYVSSVIADSSRSTIYNDTAKVTLMTSLILERSHNKVDLAETIESGEFDWVFSTPEYETAMLAWKKDPSVTAVLPRLLMLAELLETADFSSVESIKSALWDYAEETGRGEVLWPTRVALTGRERSPDPFTCAHILGKEETITRLKTACDKIEGNA